MREQAALDDLEEEGILPQSLQRERGLADNLLFNSVKPIWTLDCIITVR